MAISPVRSDWKLTLKLSVHHYCSVELFRSETSLRREAFSSIPQNSVIIEEDELLSLMPSPLCSNFLYSQLSLCFSQWLLFCSHPSSPDVLHGCPFPLYTDFYSSLQLSVPVTRTCPASLLGHPQPLQPAGLPSTLLLKL